MITIRKARPNDLEQIISLYSELGEAEKIFDSNLNSDFYNTKENYSRILKRINSRKEFFFVATENDKILGFINGYIIDEPYYKEKVGYLNDLCVTKKHRKQGIGTSLINYFTKILKEKNINFIKLNAFNRNLSAVKLYKELNFEEYSSYYIKSI